MLSERDLVKGCKDRNIKAQQELYERYVRVMLGVCYNYTGSTQDAKDLVHEGFIKVYAKIGQFKEEGSLEGWIRRIMISTAINAINQKRKNPATTLEELYHEASANFSEEEIEDEVSYTQEQLLSAVNSLSDEHRVVFTLHSIDNYSHKEIGEMLSIKEETSRSRLKRAREQLKKYLKKISETSFLKYEKE